MKNNRHSRRPRTETGDTGDHDMCHPCPQHVTPVSHQGIKKKEKKPMRGEGALSMAAMPSNVVPFPLPPPAELDAAGAVPTWEPGTMTVAKVVSAGPSAPHLPAARNVWDVCGIWTRHVAAADWFDDDKEMLVVMALNVRHYCMHIFLVSMGTTAETLGHMREIFRPLIVSGAHSFVVVHNHPSNEVEPGKTDHELLSRIKTAADMMQIYLLDFVIVGRMDRGHTMKAHSWRQEGAQ